MSIQSIAIVSIPVADQIRARDFYRDKLGFTVVRDNPYRGEARWIEVSPPGDNTTLTLVTWFESMKPGSVTGLVLRCLDVEKTRTELVSRGVDVSSVQSAPWGRFATLNDMDGNGLVLQQG